MPLWDYSSTGQSPITRVGDVSSGTTVNWHQTWWDNSGTSQGMVYSAEQYIIKDRKPQAGYTISSADIEEQPNGRNDVLLLDFYAEDISPEYWEYGLQRIMNVAVDYGENYIRGWAFATNSMVDLRPYSKISVAPYIWARDGSNSGYYNTSFTICRNRNVGRMNYYWEPPRLPTSAYTGILCNELGSGQTKTLDISGIDKAYIGWSSGGGWGGNGAVVMENIRLHN